MAPVDAPGVTETRDGSGPAPVHSALSLYATILSPAASDETTGAIVTHTFPAPVEGQPERKAYMHVIQKSGYNEQEAGGASVRVNGGLVLREGDGAFALGGSGDALELENIGDVPAEVLVFDLE